MKKATKLALAIPFAAAGLGVAGVYGLYRRIFYSPVGDQNDDYALPPEMCSESATRARVLAMIDRLNSTPFEKVSVRSFDGLELCGRYFNARSGAPVVILFHGYRGTPSRDFSGGAAIFADLGFNLLLVEQRAHCSSEGHTITFGVNERWDCLTWCRYADERFHAPIILAGISMGATTVLMASELDLPKSVRGILADCPFTGPEDILSIIAKRKHLEPAVLMPAIKLAARTFGGFTFDSHNSAVKSVRSTHLPILLIHGEADDFIPCEMSMEIAAANPDCVELYTFPGAWHGMSFLVNTDRYAQLVKDFCKRILPDAPLQGADDAHPKT